MEAVSGPESIAFIMALHCGVQSHAVFRVTGAVRLVMQIKRTNFWSRTWPGSTLAEIINVKDVEVIGFPPLQAALDLAHGFIAVTSTDLRGKRDLLASIA